MSRRSIYRTLLVGIVALACLSFTQTARAECDSERCVGKITRLYPHPTGAVNPARGVVYIGTDGNETNLACAPVSDVYIALYPNQKLFKEVYDALLNGITHNLKMQVRIDPSSSVCKVGYVVIDRE